MSIYLDSAWIISETEKIEIGDFGLFFHFPTYFCYLHIYIFKKNCMNILKVRISTVGLKLETEVLHLVSTSLSLSWCLVFTVNHWYLFLLLLLVFYSLFSKQHIHATISWFLFNFKYLFTVIKDEDLTLTSSFIKYMCLHKPRNKYMYLSSLPYVVYSSFSLNQC